MLDPQQWTEKWARNTAGATQAFRDGVDAVTTSPTEAAAAQVDRYVQGVNDAASSGRWQAGLRRVSLSAWKESMKTKGAAHISQGVAMAKPKVAAFAAEWAPYMRQLQTAIASMPKGGAQAAKDRVAFTIDFNMAFRRRG